jgi:hypothetical protein
VITVQCLQFLRSVEAAGGSVTGSADDSLATLRVVVATDVSAAAAAAPVAVPAAESAAMV